MSYHSRRQKELLTKIEKEQGIVLVGSKKNKKIYAKVKREKK